jgi:hypothetical protein
MTREQLVHAIRAACDVAQDPELWVFGSQAILGQFPDAPETLRQSAEADVAPRNYPERSDRIDGVLGERSPFHDTHGFYVHGLTLDATVLPDGWQGRTVPVPGQGPRPAMGYCVEGHDLAASKLVAFREKDRVFVRTLLVERMVVPEILIERIRALPLEEPRRESLERWVHGNSPTRE